VPVGLSQWERVPGEVSSSSCCPVAIERCRASLTSADCLQSSLRLQAPERRYHPMDDSYLSDTSATASRDGQSFAQHSKSANEYGDGSTDMQAAACAALLRRTEENDDRNERMGAAADLGVAGAYI
jgi:hypothetical protein